MKPHRFLHKHTVCLSSCAFRQICNPLYLWLILWRPSKGWWFMQGTATGLLWSLWQKYQRKKESKAAQSRTRTLKPPNTNVQFQSKPWHWARPSSVKLARKRKPWLNKPFLQKSASCVTSIRIPRGYQNGAVCLNIKRYAGQLIGHEVRIP